MKPLSIMRLRRYERGFESPSHRHHFREKPELTFRLFSFISLSERGMRTPAGVRQRAQPVGQRSLRRCPQGERSESIPLSPPQIQENTGTKFYCSYFLMSFICSFKTAYFLNFFEKEIAQKRDMKFSIKM